MIGEEGFGGNVLEVASVGGRLPLAGADGFSQIRLLKNGRYSPITFLYFSSCTSITIYYEGSQLAGPRPVQKHALFLVPVDTIPPLGPVKSSPHLDLGSIRLRLAFVLRKERGAFPPSLSIVCELEEKFEELLLSGLFLAEGVHFCRL